LITITAAVLLGSGTALAASNACKADLNGDLVVNFGDLAILKSVFFQRCNDGGPTCGDGLAQGPSEQCDDGNLLDGDGCSSTCQIEAPVAGGSFPATGRTTCWNTAGAVISCAGTGQDGDLQKGSALAYVDNGDGTITDSNTGLMWEKLSADGTIHDWNNLYTWDDAFAVKIATLNGGEALRATRTGGCRTGASWTAS
jgi:cysteine-rich repeat protein